MNKIVNFQFFHTDFKSDAFQIVLIITSVACNVLEMHLYDVIFVQGIIHPIQYVQRIWVCFCVAVVFIISSFLRTNYKLLQTSDTGMRQRCHCYVPSLALGQLYDCPSANEATLNHIIRINQSQTIINQSTNRVYNSRRY